METVRSWSRADGFAGLPGDGSERDAALRQGADAHLMLGAARCSLWWREAPPLAGQRLGVIGHYQAPSDGPDAAALLAAACAELHRQGCTLVVGPMDGSTWRRYRLVTWRGDEPPFFLEPDTPDAWVGHWTAAGFTPWAGYSSAVVGNLDGHDARLDAVAARLERDGVRIRPIDSDHFDADLDRIHALSLSAFAGNLLYTPLGREAFHAMYRPVQMLLQPGLVLIAEHQGAAVGFVFALPDVNMGKRGMPVDTLVVKTLAVAPGRIYAGLGKILLERCQQAAHGLGMRRAIHALMHDGNTSRNLGAGATTLRRYTLFARNLA